MTIGPIQVRWTKTVKAEQAKAQVRDMRHNRCIAGQHHDIQALRKTVELWRPYVKSLLREQEAKTPQGAGASI